MASRGARMRKPVVCVKFCKNGVAFSGDVGVSAAQPPCLAERRTWRAASQAASALRLSFLCSRR